jgi:hypothetical protein
MNHIKFSTFIYCPLNKANSWTSSCPTCFGRRLVKICQNKAFIKKIAWAKHFYSRCWGSQKAIAYCDAYSSAQTHLLLRHISYLDCVFSHVHVLLCIMTRSQVTRWNQLEGFTKSSCGSWDLVARSRLPTLRRGRGSSWEPKD